MRIAQLANFVGPASGGMKTAVQALAAGYVAAGAERLLVMPGPRDEREVTPYGEVVRLRAPRVGGGYRLILEPWRVIDVLERFGPTSIEMSDKSTLLPVTGWARRNRVGSLLFSHERLDAMIALRTGWETGVQAPVAVLNRVLVRRFDAVVVTSGFAESEFAPLAVPARTPLHRVPLGVDLETFHPGGAPRPHAARCGWCTRDGCPGRRARTSRSRPRSRCTAAGCRCGWTSCGSGPHRDELEEIAREAPVRFHGHVADRAELAGHLARAHVALSVCPGETFGLAVLEALASGTPVVTADVGGASELVDRSCGRRGRPDPEALADAVLEVAARPVAARRRAARTRAEDFPWSATVDHMLDLHRRVSNTQHGRAVIDLTAVTGQ